jgi:signal transduction histidine kinase/ActR/RegA family two-component response regulator
MFAALYLTQELKQEYELAVFENKQLSNTISEFRKLSFILGALNIPGNRIFESKSVERERDAFERANIWYNTAYKYTLIKLEESLNTNQRENITPFLNRLNESVDGLKHNASFVFDNFDNEVQTAAIHMARMDSYYSSSSEALNDLSEFIGIIQEMRFAEQSEVTKQVEQYQILLALLVAVIIVMVAIYGRFLSKAYQNQTEELKAALKEAKSGALAKERFLATMSHEIRTPMNGMKGMLELIEDSELTTQTQQYLSYAKQSADNLLHIVNDILHISKLDSGKIELEQKDFSVVELLQQIQSVASLSVKEKSVAIVLDTSSVQVRNVNGDEHRIRQIINNLVNNAIKFTEQGSITLKCSTKIYANGVEFTCSVIDTGIGIPEHKIGDIFNVFSQADASTTRKYGGTGLGLSISQKLAKLLNGDLVADSRLGGGSTFTLTCMLSLSKVHHESPVAQDSSDLPNEMKEVDMSQLTVLVAEDEKVNQVLVKAVLKKMGCQFDLVKNGEKVIEALEQKMDYDLILMDCQMPILDGYETTKRIRASKQTWSTIPIIAVTANALPEDKQKCLKVGMDGYISKPINVVELKEAMLNEIKQS